MTAPFVSHPLLERAVAEASAPTWDPSEDVVRFLATPTESVRQLVDWIAEVHHRGLCTRCGAPVEWSPAPVHLFRSLPKTPESCALPPSLERLDTGAGRSLPHRRARWYRVPRLGTQRVERYLSILRHDYPKPKKTRLGHAATQIAPPVLEPESSSHFASINSLRRHEAQVLIDPGDDVADRWLREHG